MLKLTQNQTFGLLLVLVVLIVFLFSSKSKKGIITTIEKYRAKVDTLAYYVMRNDDFEYGWNPDFSKAAKTFKAGEIVGDAVGIFPTINANGKQFTLMVFEVPFVYGAVIYLCVDKNNLALIQ